MAGSFPSDFTNDANGVPAQFTRPKRDPSRTRPETHRTVARIAILAAAILLITPAAVTLAMASKPDAVHAPSIAVHGQTHTIAQHAQ